MNKLLIPLFFVLSLFQYSFAQKEKKPLPKPPVAITENGKLDYAIDALGNRIPDFSFCGYMAGDRPLPYADNKVFVKNKKGDATQTIQNAINQVAKLPLNEDGMRGAVLLDKGVFEVSGSLHINTSGVILRGSGHNETSLVGIGETRETLIVVKGKADKTLQNSSKIIDGYVPVNALRIKVADAASFRVGDKIMVQRPSTKEWIEKIGTAHFGGGVTALGWKPNQRDIYWDRTISQIKDKTLFLDTPITTAIDSAYGGGVVWKYTWDGRISQVGIENLQLVSDYDKTNLKDEDHRWAGIVMENIQDAWVRQSTFKHFAGSAVYIGASARRITVEDCISTEPISEIGGLRRNTFFTEGQQTLFQRIYAENGIHDFAVGYCTAGPNAFVQCESKAPYSFSGTIDSWASGVLFDIVNVDGNAIRFANRGQDGQGAGWSAANSVLWQCSAAMIECQSPPTAQNWALGTWAQFSGDAYWYMSNEHIKPRSLYYAQLKDRLGAVIDNRVILMPAPTDASSSPKVEVAMELTKLSANPSPTLHDLILQRIALQNTSKVPSQTTAIVPEEKDKNALSSAQTLAALEVSNGWLVRAGNVQKGIRQEVPWWNGSARPYGLEASKPHITRFVPPQVGKGLTDDLDELTDWMTNNNIKAIDHNYGLWYDRRRDDHERIRRMDGEVWAPFYELPFARSGKETAWDGLSKYDLTKYNKWYWNRLKQFADLADRKNLVLIHQNYFQHNIIEAGAHYADFPWRTANNINSTGFPEPVPYAGDKRIFMADAFYDISHPVRRMIHRNYIRKCLDNFGNNTGVIQLIGSEFTGPLHFVEFWLDVIQEWEKEKKKTILVGLSTTKDVQDAILADKKRSNNIDIIDIRYWHYQSDATVYAPQGGQNLAPRQHARLLKPKRSSFEQVYRAVLEYRQKYPDKAVTYAGDSHDSNGWAVFMAGGSLAHLPKNIPNDFMTDACTMQPIETDLQNKRYVSLGNIGKKYIIYYDTPDAISVDLTNTTGTFKVQYLNTKTGVPLTETDTIQGGKVVMLQPKSTSANIIWITKL